MEENLYFQKALSDFTREAASGGAIRHLADLGYTVRQITEELDFPTPYETVRQAVWKRLVEKNVVRTEEPGSGGQIRKAAYVREYDRYGKATFRRVTEETEESAVDRWNVREIVPGGETPAGEIGILLKEKVRENGETDSYASCDFGLLEKKNPEEYREMLRLLDEGQREYICGLPWECRRVYHRLDGRMLEILARLCGEGRYRGECFFLKTKDRVRIV